MVWKDEPDVERERIEVPDQLKEKNGDFSTFRELLHSYLVDAKFFKNKKLEKFINELISQYDKLESDKNQKRKKSRYTNSSTTK